MKMQWKRLWVKAAIWVATEIILNVLGLDNLADYSEFIFEKEVAIATHQTEIAAMVPPRRPQFHYNLPDRFTLAVNL